MSSSPYKRSPRTIEIGDHLWQTLQTMAEEMSADPATLVNQALFAFARANGYLAPGDVAKGEPPGKLAPPNLAKLPRLSPQKPGQTAGSIGEGLTHQLANPLRAEVSTDPVARAQPRPKPARPLDLSEERTGALPSPLASAPQPAPEPPADSGPVPDYLPDEATGSQLKALPELVKKGPERTLVGRAEKKLFLLLEGQPPREIDAGRFVIGRDSTCQLTLRSSRLSRQHVAIVRDPSGITIEDLGSSNGTWFKGERITKRPVSNGDEFTLGDVKVKFELR